MCLFVFCPDFCNSKCYATIYYGLYPQSVILNGHVAYQCAHAAHPDKSSYAECAGEQPCHALPESWYAALRPTDACHE